MSATKPEVEWLMSFPYEWDTYGVVCLAGKWAAVKSDTLADDRNYELITDWVDDRKTAVGFLKLLKGN